MSQVISYPIGAGGLVTRVLECGVGSRHAVFLHGVGARADRWHDTLERYAALGMHCVAFDLPGHGFASKGREPEYSVPAFAELTLDLLNTLGMESAMLVGTSLGGHVASRVAVTHPDRVRALMLVGTMGLVPLAPEALQAIQASIVRVDRDAIRQKLHFVLARHDLITERWVEQEWRINNSPGAIEAFHALGDYLVSRSNDDNVARELRALRDNGMPMSLLWGEADRAIDLQIGERSARAIGDIPLCRIPNAGHAPYFESPEAFDSEVAPFLQSVVF